MCEMSEQQSDIKDVNAQNSAVSLDAQVQEQMHADVQYMMRALELAKKGAGFVNPNPMVGAVVVKDDRIIGEGFHKKFGELHAERCALANCSQDPAGATVYVTLEPCCHYGKTPPCTRALIDAKVKRVVVGSLDPNPLVAGKGITMLQEQGIEVTTNVLEEQALTLNRPFFHFITTKKPLVILKYAMTLDGKIATKTGNSRWISGEEARINTHRDRGKYAAIMVGSTTVLKDNPRLTCRIDGGHNPLRIVVDGSLKIPLECNLVQTAKDVDTLIATYEIDTKRIEPYIKAGCEVLTIPTQRGRNSTSMHIDLALLIDELGKMNIDSVLIEAGPSLASAALDARIVDRIQAYISPKIFGGVEAPCAVGGEGIDIPSQCIHITNRQISTFGQDILIEGEVEYCLAE